jgi:glycosyltransferase involved in cell wall biosynthesis
MRVLALTKYDALAATTRQRFLQYQPYLERAGFVVDYAPLLGNDHVARLVHGGRASMMSVAYSYLKRLERVLFDKRYDLLWVHLEGFPYLPGLVERLLSVRGKPIIYDFDDAIFHMYDASPNGVVRLVLKNKLAPLLRSATACCCGNPYLRDYAARYCPNSVILPTVVDTAKYVPALPRNQTAPLTMGWIGSPSTWQLVQPHLPMLADLCQKLRVRFRVVGAGAAAEKNWFPQMDLVEWTEAGEINEVHKMDIGIMPVWDGPFQRGKSGYKLIQYMACGLPVVGSPVGVNSEIIRHGQNGFLATSTDEWRAALVRLVENASLRRAMGDEGRRLTVELYSLASQAPRLVDIFQSATVACPPVR